MKYNPVSFFKFFFTTFQWNTIDNTFALAVLQARFNNLKFRWIYHDWNLGNIWVGQSHPDKSRHSFFTVYQAVVQIEIKDLGTIFNLVFGNGDRGFVIIVLDQLLELGTSRDVASFTDIYKWYMVSQYEFLHAG